MPTGGVSLDEANIKAWITAGAVCVGMGSDMVRKEWLAARDFEKITASAKQALQWIREARSK